MTPDNAIWWLKLKAKQKQKEGAPIFQGGTLPVTDITAEPIGKGKYLAEFDKQNPRQEYKETNEYIRIFQPEKVVQKQAWRDVERNRLRDNYAESYMIRDRDLKMQQRMLQNKNRINFLPLSLPIEKKDNVNTNSHFLSKNYHYLVHPDSPISPKYNQPKQNNVANIFDDVGTRLLNSVQTFGASIIGDAINTISPTAADVIEKYTMGIIPHTSQQQLESNRGDNNKAWENRTSNTANAVTTAIIGEMLGAGMNWGANKIASGELKNKILATPLIKKGVESTGELLNKSVQNTYKLNPWAFKPNPKSYYRGIGEDGLKDALESGVFRSPTMRPASKSIYKTPEIYWADGNNFDVAKRVSVRTDNSIMKGKSIIAEYPKVEEIATKYRGLNNEFIDNYASQVELPIHKGRILQKDWLKGYKEIKVPKKQYGTDFPGTLTDKEKEMYRWFEKQQKLNALPKTTNKKTLGILEDFKTRIQTPEGKKRMKELGINSDEMLQKIQIVEDPTTFGYFSGDRNRAVLNPLDPLPTQTARHEIEHGVQNAFQKQAIKNEGKIIPTFKKLFTDPLLKKPLPKSITDANTKIDDLLSGLELRKQGTPNKQWRGHVERDSPVDISEYKSLISNRQNATDYFLTGSKGREKSAFLGEVQQYMMNNNIIPKTSYTEVTPEMVKNTFINAMFDETGGGKYLRLFNIMKPSEANYKLISEGLNKMLGLIPPAAVIGAETLKEKNENK